LIRIKRWRNKFLIIIYIDRVIKEKRKNIAKFNGRNSSFVIPHSMMIIINKTSHQSNVLTNHVRPKQNFVIIIFADNVIMEKRRKYRQIQRTKQLISHTQSIMTTTNKMKHQSTRLDKLHLSKTEFCDYYTYWPDEVIQKKLIFSKNSPFISHNSVKNDPRLTTKPPFDVSWCFTLVACVIVQVFTSFYGAISKRPFNTPTDTIVKSPLLHQKWLNLDTRYLSGILLLRRIWASQSLIEDCQYFTTYSAQSCCTFACIFDQKPKNYRKQSFCTHGPLNITSMYMIPVIIHCLGIPGSYR
jgi:hypothetical protein